MKYSRDELRLLTDKLSGSELSKEEKLALYTIMESYNKLYCIAIKQHKHIKTKEEQWARDMDLNFKLNEKNEYLKSELDRYKLAYKNLGEYTKDIEKDLSKAKKYIKKITKEE